MIVICVNVNVTKDVKAIKQKFPIAMYLLKLPPDELSLSGQKEL